MAPIDEPQVGQKAREEMSEERHVAGLPPGLIQRTAWLGNSAQTAVRLPVWRWHILQEQVCGLAAGASASKRIAPQRQPPVWSFFFAMINPPEREAIK
jgi:hypothetical protein